MIYHTGICKTSVLLFFRAEYWKSLPRKFCDICKCWFADNKASIDFHERGKRHQENAQKRIQDIQKRGIKDFKKQQQLENEMEKIEKAALAAYEKDLKNLHNGEKSQPTIQPPKKISYSVPESNIKPNSSVKNVHKKKEIALKSTEVTVESTHEKTWYEAMSEDGYKYYWNTETSESRWEPPEEGYISIEEQNQVNPETVTEEQQLSSNESETVEKEKETSSDDVVCSVGPQPRVDPYGQWVTVEKEEPVDYDLQLPSPSENAVEIVIPIHKDECTLKFKEKIIGQLSDTEPGEVTFKKRKLAGSFKKNARQRTTDDD